MSLETPNSLAASLVFWYALEGELPPGLDNAEQLVITAADGILSLRTVGEPAPELLEGFYVELQHPVVPENGTYFLTGYEQGNWLPTTGFTPFPVDLAAAPASVVEQSQTQGNFLLYNNEPEQPFGLVQLAMWTTPPTQTALPVALPIPAP